jgi:hypothetical protein
MSNSRVRRARRHKAERRLKQLERTGAVIDEVTLMGPLPALPADDLALIIMDPPAPVSSSRAIGQGDFILSLNHPFFDPLDNS